MPRWLKIVMVVATIAGPFLAVAPLLALPVLQAIDWDLAARLQPFTLGLVALGLVMSYGPGLAMFVVNRLPRPALIERPLTHLAKR